jgi:hypothetical protein
MQPNVPCETQKGVVPAQLPSKAGQVEISALHDAAAPARARCASLRARIKNGCAKRE